MNAQRKIEEMDVALMRCFSDLDDLRAELARVKAENEGLREILLNVIIQATSDGDNLDSMALTSYAEAMRCLADYGLIEIKSDYGRRVIAMRKALED